MRANIILNTEKPFQPDSHDAIPGGLRMAKNRHTNPVASCIDQDINMTEVVVDSLIDVFPAYLILWATSDLSALRLRIESLKEVAMVEKRCD